MSYDNLRTEVPDIINHTMIKCVRKRDTGNETKMSAAYLHLYNEYDTMRRQFNELKFSVQLALNCVRCDPREEF